MHQPTIMIALALTSLCVLTEARWLPRPEQRSVPDVKFELAKRLLELMERDADEYAQLKERLFAQCSCIQVATQPGGSSTCLPGGCPAGCGDSYDSKTGMCSGGAKAAGAAAKKTRQFDNLEDLFYN